MKTFSVSRWMGNAPRDCFIPLGLKSTRRGKSGSWIVIPPSSRPDISREADVIEELARLHGYDNIPIDVALAAIVGRQE